MKRRAMLLAAIILVCLTVGFTGCTRREEVRTGVDAIESYTDIPGITEAEVSAIETVIAQRGGFTYGHLWEAEAFRLSEDEYTGFTIELTALLSGLFGAEFKTVVFDEWADMKAALDERAIDFSGGFTKTEEHLRAYWMTTPIAGRSMETYMLKDAQIAKADELNGERIGVLGSSALLETIERHYPAYRFEAVAFDSYAEGVRMLEQGWIKAIIATSAADPMLRDFNTVMHRNFFSLAYYPVCITTAESDLAPIISAIDKYLAAGGIERVFQMHKKGMLDYKKHSLRLQFTDEERAYLNEMLASGRRVNIGLQHDAYPASFYNDVEMEYQGVSIDVLKQITELTGLEFEPMSTSETTTLATILEKLRTGEIEMMTQLLRTESRKGDYIWSDVEYLTTNYALLSGTDYPNVEIYQVPWARVGTVDRSAHEVMFEQWFPEHPMHVVYATTNEAFDALDAGEIDLLMLSENMLLQQTNLRQKTRFKVNLKFDVPLDSYFGFSKDEVLLRSVVDKAMGYIDIVGIASGWMNRVFDYSTKISEIRATYLYFFSIAAIIMLVVVFLLFLKNHNLSRHLMGQTATLSTIYQSMPDSIFCKNKDGVYTSCNPTFERQAGLAEADIVGKTYAEVFANRVADKIEMYREIDCAIMRDHSTRMVEEEVIFPDGSIRQLETLKAPLIQGGEVVGILGIGRDVTERGEIKNRLDSIINTAQIAFIMTLDGIVIEANRYCREHVGLKIGDDIMQIYADPEQRDEIIELAEEQGASYDNVLNITIANGEEHRFLMNVTVIEYEKRKAYIVWALDIEQDEKRRDLLRETQLSFQTVLDTLPMPIRIIDIKTRKIVYVNNGLLELLEYSSPEELCGRTIDELLTETMSNGRESARQVDLLMIETPRPISLDMEYITKSGRVVECVVVSRHIDYNGKRSSIGIVKDLTKEKRIAQILRNAVEREKEANQAKSLFLANMSHEIRTPMNGIIGMTDLMLVEELSERQRRYANEIKMSAESLLSIINDILDLSKISEGKLQITPVDVDLNLLLKNTVSMMRFAAQSKGLSFIDDIRLNAPEYVRVDDIRLKQIIVNLLSNATKFTKEGYVKLMAQITGGGIEIEISDTGIGIHKEDLPLIFSAFEQVDKRKNRTIKGTGLGLSITKNLVGLMDGNIWVESEYGEGSTFHIVLPYVPGNETSTQETEAEFEYIFAPTAQVLLVDDIQTNLTVGAGLLRLCGITADVAMSGPEAIEYVKQKDYDIVFMDHMMPQMNGIEAMEAIRALGDKQRGLTIIALTANAVSDSRALLLASGMDDFLSKPIDKKELVGILNKWLPSEKIKSVTKAAAAEDTVYSQALRAASEIDGLNIELALNRIGGLHDVLEASIKQVAYSIDEKLRNMDNCLAAADFAGFAVDAHGLKSALANIGAMRNSELAAALEIGAKAENMTLCVEQFDVFASELRGLATELKKAFFVAEPGDKPVGAPELLAQQTAAAIGYLEGFEAADALACLTELARFAYGEPADAVLQEAIRAVERFAYDEAIGILQGLLRKGR